MKRSRRVVSELDVWKSVAAHHRLRTARFRRQALILATDLERVRTAVALHREQMRHTPRSAIDTELWHSIDDAAPAHEADTSEAAPA